MFETLFGSGMPLAASFFVAFLIVLGLIALTAWLVHRFRANLLGASAARGRQRRLAVIDAATVDKRRRLVLIRRDNIEHLLMIGGPTDLVLEPNIVRVTGARDAATPRAAEPAPPAPALPETSWPPQSVIEPAPHPYRATLREEPRLPSEPAARPRPTADSLTRLAAELSTRLAPPPDLGTSAEPARPVEPPQRAPARPESSWPLQPVVEPAPRPYRATLREEPRLPPEPAARRADSLAGLAAELSTRLAPPPVLGTSAEPARPVEPPPASEPADKTLTQRLGAALHRTPAAEAGPPVTDPFVAAPKAADALLPVLREPIPAKLDITPEPLTVKPEAKTDSAKNLYDNLEQELASLLGRPTNKP